MIFKKFVIVGLLSIVGAIALVVSINVYMNEFGLFGNVKSKQIRIYDEERTSKYLLSFNYIPKNFDAILFGPSLSDIEMDTKNLKGLKVYNLSLNGANISELKYSVENVIKKGNLKVVIVCLNPYLTKDSGKKTSSIDPKEYWSSLGSIFTLKFYRNKYFLLKYPEQDVFRDSWYGFRYNNLDVYEKYNSKEKINELYKVIQKGEYKIKIDPVALNELNEVLKLARVHGVKVFAYYYPTHNKVFEADGYQIEYKKYRKEIEQILRSNDIVLDFNIDKYNYIRNNYETYSDGSHLSSEGGKKVIEVMQQTIYEHKLDKL